MLPNFAWVKWFNLAPVLYNSQEKVGLPCLILSMGAGLIGEIFKCNGVNALMWLHLRGHQGPLGDPIYSLHMSKMHGPFGVNLPDEGDIEGCKLIWRWHTVDMMRPRGRYKVEVMGVISPLTLHDCSSARLLVGLLQEVTRSSLLKPEAILQCRLLKKGNNALPPRLLLGDKSVLQRGECYTVRRRLLLELSENGFVSLWLCGPYQPNGLGVRRCMSRPSRAICK
jgi:hypothetical protein